MAVRDQFIFIGRSMFLKVDLMVATADAADILY